MAQTSAAPGITAEQLKEARQAARDRQRIKEGGAVLRSVATGTVVSGVVLTGTAETPPVTPGRAQRAGAMVVRVGRGVRTAPEAFRAWRLATEFDARIVAFEEGGDQKAATAALLAQLTEGKARRERAAKVARPVAILAPAVLFGGWPWATVVALLALIGALVLLQFKAMHGKVVSWLAGVFGVSLLLTAISWYVLGVRPSGGLLWSPGYLLVPALILAPAVLYAVIWAIKATKDDGTIADQLRGGTVAEMAPAEVERDDTPPVVKAVVATGKLKDASPRLVAPGILPGNGGAIWTATIDTGGPSATVLTEKKTREDLAARLGLSDRRLLLTVDEDYGSRIHLTGIVGQPFADDVRHPLLDARSVDLWRPFPFGVDVAGNEVTYAVPGVNSLFGGESGAGKSVAVFGIIAAFALAPTAQIWAIDGGEADTRVLDRTGLAAAWTSERPRALEILAEVKAEVDRRQRIIGDASDDDDVKMSPELMAEYGIGHLLLIIDELASFTQDGSAEAKTFIETLLPIVQRARKTGTHLLLSTQSPSRDALDPDARDVISTRWCGRARSVDLAGKVLGRGAVGRGLDPRSLPDVDGVGWLSGPRMETVVRPYYLTRRERRTICDRGVELRKGTASTARSESLGTVHAVAALIRAEGVTVADGRRVMRSKDVADRLRMDQMQLAAALGPEGIRTQKVRRTDDSDADNRMHYVLADFPASRVG